MNTRDFYDALPRLTAFDDLIEGGSYTPLPDDWSVGVADIVGSTQEIARGGYKTVNMVGAAVISAQINTIGPAPFPYVFGGDGAGFACPPHLAAQAAGALAAVRTWAQEEFGLTLRTAILPVRDIRAAGFDVTVARYQASPDVDYAMFAGGGITWAETQMKAGRLDLPAAPPGARPDLNGLSCRWSHMPARNGSIVSLVILPVPGAPPAEFARVAERVLGIVHHLDRDGHPVPEQGAGVRWPTKGLEQEARALRDGGPLWLRRIKLLGETLFAWAVLRSGVRLGNFDPAQYRRAVGRNADFRKFDDGLKMTLDCDAATLAQLRATLSEARAEGTIDFGLFEQDEAMMTCIVPSVSRDDHVHFIDGASGGYARAAAMIGPRAHRPDQAKLP
ncbi:DUF3095 domain-containing protein [Arenibacterium halophilum]|uniref:DUF3095 domain-containing protein n=1 Tax=Arenibacterium halophilum TaxID=2583821 RepID=A0ABY2X6A0_9RHOB|nr:DUF3095 domain-containing protein [Arenibacterium halophilum]TMV11318.1 DUF3095 domain-containing protein [Arenibacterium halophilum]